MKNLAVHLVSNEIKSSVRMALRSQILAARSIIRAAIRPLNRLTGQAKLGFNEAFEASAPRRFSSGPPSRRPRRILRGHLAEMADRDLVWRRTDTVVLK